MDFPKNLWDLPDATFPSLSDDESLGLLSKQLNPTAAPNQPISAPPIAQQINQQQGVSPPVISESSAFDDSDFLSILSKQLKTPAAPSQGISPPASAQQINQQQGVVPPIIREPSPFPARNKNRGLAKSAKHVRHLEEQVAVLEAKGSAQTTENENLRDLLGRLQNENLTLKQSAFTFNPDPAQTPRSTSANGRAAPSPATSHELEEKVAALEQRSSAQATENENLRELLGRLQNENLQLKQSMLTAWHVNSGLLVSPRPAGNQSSSNGALDLSRFVKRQGGGAHSLAGYSDVWRGELTQPIAVKVLRMVGTSQPNDPQSDRIRTRFDRELTIWAQCQHPRVLELLGYAYIDGIPCLISPWCTNGNIMEYLAKNTDAPRRQLIYQVAEGLVYLHGRDPPVIHADIKPANVLISDEGNAKICDFGISKLMLNIPSGFTTTASAKGTLRYSSKELLEEGAQSTTMSDVYAFGMLILHVMTGKPPYFKCSTDPPIIMAIMSGKTPAPTDYPELPSTDSYWGAMLRCWNEDPNKRPTMAGLLYG